MNKRLIQAGIFAACLAVIAVGGYFGARALNLFNNSPVVSLTASNYQQVLKDSNTPVYIEFCGANYKGCPQQNATVDRLAGSYKGKVLFATVDVDTQPALVNDLLGVNKSAVSQFPISVVVGPHDGGLLAAAGGIETSSQLKAMLDGSLVEVEADNEHLIHVISASQFASLLQNGSTQPTVVEICALAGGSCLSEGPAAAQNALAYKGKVTVDVFVLESAQSASDQQLVQEIAQALGLQNVPDFVFINGHKVGAVGSLDAAQLKQFIAAGLAAK